MADFFLYLLIGHLIGDFFIQSNWMALNKKSDWLPLLSHCALYTVSVFLFTMTFFKPSAYFDWIAVIFLSHLCLDGTEYVDMYLTTIRSRGYELTAKMIEEYGAQDPKSYYAAAYTAIVQVVVDNTIHLCIMLMGFLYINNLFGR